MAETYERVDYRWVVMAFIGFLITCISTYITVTFSDIGLYINLVTLFFVAHIVLMCALPALKASTLYLREWGKVIKSVVFLMCLFLSGVPSFVAVQGPSNLLALVGLMMWGFGLELTIDSKTEGNIFNLTLCVVFSVGITIFTTTAYVTTGKLIAFGLPILGTFIYQSLAPKSRGHALVSLVTVEGNKQKLIEGQLYRFVYVDDNDVPQDYENLVSLIGSMDDGEEFSINYRLIPAMKNEVAKEGGASTSASEINEANQEIVKFQLTDARKSVGLWEVLVQWYRNGINYNRSWFN